MDIDRGHAGMERLCDGTIDKEGGAAGQAHAVDLVRALDHAATGRNGSG